MLKICETHRIIYEDTKYAQGCPVCLLNNLLDQEEQINRELREENHRQAEELGRPTMVAIINREMLEICQKMIAISDLWIPVAVPIKHEDEANALHDARERMLAAIATSEREAKREHPEEEKPDGI